MSKYRIITNGICYRAQKKILFWWETEKEYLGPDGFFRYLDFLELEHAQKHIKSRQEAEAIVIAPWRAIDG